jgi:hypothetical protein
MSITYYSNAKNIFAVSSGAIGALKSLIEPRRPDLDHAERASDSRDRTSQQAYIFNCEWITKLGVG